MKRFLLFTGVEPTYGGGWRNFDGDFDSAEEARREGGRIWVIKVGVAWMHIVDTQTKEVVMDYDLLVGSRWRKWTGRIWIDA